MPVFRLPAALLALLLFAAAAQAQDTATLEGRVSARVSGQEISGANVLVAGTLLGTVTDEEGRYRLEGIRPGEVTVQVRYVGYQPYERRLELAPGEVRELNVRLRSDLDGVGADFAEPEEQAFGLERAWTASGTPLPVRTLAEALATLPGTDRAVGREVGEGVVFGQELDDEATPAITIRGAAPTYYQDGLLVPNGVWLPWEAHRRVRLYAGHVPARFGQSLGVVADVETAEAAAEWLAFEGITSERLDAYGYNLASATAGGSFFDDRLRLFATADARWRDDADPRATEIARVRDDVLASLRAQPQAFAVYDPQQDAARFLPLPQDIGVGDTIETLLVRLAEENPDLTLVPVGSAAEQVAQASYGSGATRVEIPDLRIVLRSNLLGADAFEREAAQQENEDRQLQAFASASLNARPGTTVRLGGSLRRADRPLWTYRRALFAPEAIPDVDERGGRAFAALEQDLPGGFVLDLRGAYALERAWRYPQAFSQDVRDALFYVDVDGAAGEVARRYLTFWSPSDSYQQALSDGFSTVGCMLGSTAEFVCPGDVATRYERTESAVWLAEAHVTGTYGRHDLDAGLAFRRSTERAYVLEGGPLAGYYADFEAEATTDGGVDRYEDLPDAAFRQTLRMNYGYDLTGLEETDAPDGLVFPDNLDAAPFEPTRLSGYLEDVLEIGPLALTAGLRVDRFDHDTPVLYDIFSQVPVIRARDLEGAVPEGVEGDAAVYFDDFDNVVGYRARNTLDFVDAEGAGTSFQLITNQNGYPEPLTNANGDDLGPLHEDNLVDYEAAWAWQPRLAGTLQLPYRAQVHGYYGRHARQPWTQMAARPGGFSITSAFLGRNQPALRPERVRTSGLGLTVAVTERLSLAVEHFRRSYRDFVVLQRFVHAYPRFYSGYVNADRELEVNGWDLRAAYEVQRLSASLSYTLQDEGLADVSFDQGPLTASGRSSAPEHLIKAQVGGRLGVGEGPKVGNLRPLARSALSLFLDARSGVPYVVLPQAEPLNSNSPFTFGTVTEETTPWNVRLDLYAERAFHLAQADVTAFVWIQNLFGGDNIQRVYRATGEPDDDGFLDTQEGRNAVQSALDPDAYAAQYRLATENPQHYGLPRQVRLGLRLAL